MTQPTRARSSYTVNFAPKPARRPAHCDTGRVPRVARMLALAHVIDAKIRSGEFRNLADAARAIDVTRARMTQLMNLLLLAPEIQEAILALPPTLAGRDSITERTLRDVVIECSWEDQRRLWKQIGRVSCQKQD